MLKIKKIWFLVVPVFMMVSCITPSSVSSSISCSGNMIVEDSHYRKVSSGKREHLVKKNSKFQKKSKNEF